jgi:hypothetical protein
MNALPSVRFSMIKFTETTKEQHPERRSGSFESKVCKTEVHARSGLYEFFDWTADKMMSPVFGKK